MHPKNGTQLNAREVLDKHTLGMWQKISFTSHAFSPRCTHFFKREGDYPVMSMKGKIPLSHMSPCFITESLVKQLTLF